MKTSYIKRSTLLAGAAIIIASSQVFAETDANPVSSSAEPLVLRKNNAGYG